MVVTWDMLAGLQTVAERESLLLAPYAMHSRDSRGRREPETEHPYRGPYQRDRDRILHSAAFRRLAGKMQVFTGERGDYHRTRLTHTHEVASIARTIGRALRLNEDLIEALALFHDIGHPPYGHAGEDALNVCLADEDGFSHNRYALTIAAELEQRHAGTPGLNLTWEVLAGQAARASLPAEVGEGAPLLEAQVVEIADSITYDAHDTDDAVKLGLVRLEAFGEVTLVRETLERIRARRGVLERTLLRKAVVYDLIDRQVNDVLTEAGRELARRQFPSAAAAQRHSWRIAPSVETARKKRELEQFLYERVYRHPDLIAIRTIAQQRLKALFARFARQPELLPVRFRRRAELVGVRRAVGDYLAGMTDRYCEAQYARWCPADG